jgi:hypothetical protein
MTDLKHFKALVEGLLFEANVANADAIDMWVGELARECDPEQGKQWLTKKLRKQVLNTPELMAKIDPENLTTEYPDYILKAAERGEDIYFFEPERFGTQQIAHIIDWFNAMHDVVQRQPTNPVEVQDKVLTDKALGKLMKLNVADAVEAADEWFKHMGSRTKGEKIEREGVEVVLEWPDGYYAVRYTDKNTMMQDGHDLQNCLRQGYYWDAVQKGSTFVYGIRKPTDEAVVGLRIVKKTEMTSLSGKTASSIALGEIKGKNNKPVGPNYRRYAADLLTHLKVPHSVHDDLKGAKLYSNDDGRYGTFEDLAKLVIDADGVKVYQVGNDITAHVDGNVLDFTNSGEGISGDGAGDPVALLKALNAMKTKPTKEFAGALARQFIYYTDGKYGDPRTIGTALGNAAGIDMFEVDAGVFLYKGDKRVAHIIVSEQEIQAIRYSVRDDSDLIDDSALSQILNALGKRPASSFEPEGLRNAGLVYDGERYGTVDELGVAVGDDVYQIGKRKVWVILGSRGSIEQMAKMVGNTFVVSSRDDVQPPILRVDPTISNFRPVVAAIKPKKVKDPLALGVIYDGEDVYADRAGLFKAMKKHAVTVRDQRVQVQMLDHREVVVRQIDEALKIEGRVSGFTRKELDFIHKYSKAKQPLFMIPTQEQMYDLTIKRVQFNFPKRLVYLLMLLTSDTRTDKDDLKHFKNLVATEMRAGIAKAIEIVGEQEGYYTTDIHSSFPTAYGLVREYDELQSVIKAAKKAVDAKVAERQANPDKYATDLTSRFAALNAIRNIKD